MQGCGDGGRGGWEALKGQAHCACARSARCPHSLAHLPTLPALPRPTLPRPGDWHLPARRRPQGQPLQEEGADQHARLGQGRHGGALGAHPRHPGLCARGAAGGAGGAGVAAGGVRGEWGVWVGGAGVLVQACPLCSFFLCADLVVLPHPAAPPPLLQYIADDELVEVTPTSVRMRKSPKAKRGGRGTSS